MIRIKLKHGLIVIICGFPLSYLLTLVYFTSALWLHIIKILTFLYFCYIHITAHPNSYDEVIVGAPMYSNVEDIKVETGRTYIFRNTGVSNFTIIIHMHIFIY